MRNAVRRFGTKPTGLTPARRAMASAQAPAALMRIGAAKLPAVVVTLHSRPLRSIASTSALTTSRAPRALAPLRNPWCRP